MGDIFLKLVNERIPDCPKMLKKRSHELHIAVREVTMNIVRRAQILACLMFAEFGCSLEWNLVRVVFK